MADPARLAAGSEASEAQAAPSKDLPVSPRAEPPAPEVPPPPPGQPPESTGSITRVFGSPLYFRLWLAQFASSLGDWIGFVAITAISNRIAGTNGVALVLSARLVPGFFLGSVGGLLADRLDRKKLMVACDIGRGVVVGLLPFVHRLPLLFLINLVLEALTLLWTPAKEATVPNLVSEEQLPKVNSLGLAAAYGTFPLGAGLFTALAAVAAYLGRFEHLSVLKVNQENLAIWTDTCTFLLSAFLISTLAIPRRNRRPSTGKVDLGQGVRDVREGWRFIGQNAVVRSVILAMSCGLIGGGMVVPLGPGFARDVLGGGPRAFGALITAAGLGVALGVVGVTSVQKRLRPERVFLLAMPVAGVCLAAAASMSVLTPALLFVALFGMAGGAIYVFGFSLVQAHTEDELRGRIFSALYAAVRLCIVLSFVLGPLLAGLLGDLSQALVGGELPVGGWHVALPGSRIALWLAGGIILGSGILARRSLRADAERRSRQPSTDPDPSPDLPAHPVGPVAQVEPTTARVDVPAEVSEPSAANHRLTGAGTSPDEQAAAPSASTANGSADGGGSALATGPSPPLPGRATWVPGASSAEQPPESPGRRSGYGLEPDP